MSIRGKQITEYEIANVRSAIRQMIEHVLLYDQVYSFYDKMLLTYINIFIFGINE
jgi:hypothetical protein